MIEVGSMEVVGVYRDAGLFASLEGTKTRIKESVNQAKILKEETHLLQKVAQEAAASFGSFAVGVEGAEEVEELKRIYEEAAIAAQNFGGLQFGGLVDELKDVENKTKTVSVSMKRLKAVVLTAGVAMAGLALGFLSMLKNAIGSSPYLIGALTRIKTDLMLMGWALSKHLKPAFDLLADAIHALRKGDWEFFKTKAKEAWNYFIEVVKGAWSWIKEHGPEWLSNIMQTLEDMASRIVGFDWEGKGLWEGFKNVIKTVWDEVIDPLLPEWLSDLISALGTWISENEETIATTLNHIWDLITWNDAGEAIAAGIWQGIKNGFANWANLIKSFWINLGKEFAQNIIDGMKTIFDKGDLPLPYSGTRSSTENYDNITITPPSRPGNSSVDLPWSAIGKYVVSDGPIYAHAGEEIIPANSNRQTNQISEIKNYSKDTIINNLTTVNKTSNEIKNYSKEIINNQKSISNTFTGIKEYLKETTINNLNTINKIYNTTKDYTKEVINNQKNINRVLNTFTEVKNQTLTQESETNITVDFTGADISLSSGLDLDSFAERISRKIADQQSWSQY